MVLAFAVDALIIATTYQFSSDEDSSLVEVVCDFQWFY